MSDETKSDPMSAVGLCDEIMDHMVLGAEKYSQSRSSEENMVAIRDRMTKLESAMGSYNDESQRFQIRRRALQMCGILMRLVQEGGFLPKETP